MNYASELYKLFQKSQFLKHLSNSVHKDHMKTGFEGYFKIECINNKDEVIDTFEEHNMIMTTARSSMSEIFANLDGILRAHKFVLGTRGCNQDTPFVPRDEYDGLVKDRNRLFSEVAQTTYVIGDVIDTLYKYDVIGVLNASATVITYYEFLGDYVTSYVITEEGLADETVWNKLDGKPYTYELDFELPGNNEGQEYPAISSAGDTYKVVQSDTTVTFTFTIGKENANEEYSSGEKYTLPTSLFNEAALYVNNRIFSMKTFSTKVKDESVKLKITWSIIF